MDTRKKYLHVVSTFPSLKADNSQDYMGDVGPAGQKGLSELQAALAQMTIDLVGQFGQFDKKDSQYVDKSPQNFSCIDCGFYTGAGDCSILNEQVDPLGLCRFNVCLDEAEEH